ncbi:MAG: hypothetical protein ACJ79R_20540 [Anaeromyxobacteraceae bacterium]
MTALEAAAALAAELLTPGNGTIGKFVAHGDDSGEQRWTLVWAKGEHADRLRRWLDALEDEELEGDDDDD